MYGPNRSGKTVWSCGAPKPLLLVDCEPEKDGGGARSVKGVSGVTFLKLDDMDSIMKLAEELTQHNPFRTIVLDSVTSLERIVLGEIMKMPAVKDMMSPKMIGLGAAAMDIYSERAIRMRKVLRPYLDMPCHTVFTAKQKDHNPNKSDQRSKLVREQHEESFFGPDVGGGTAEWLKDACDIVQLGMVKEIKVHQVKVGDDVIDREEETGRKVRRLRITNHPNFAVGVRSSRLDIPDYIDEPTFDKFMSVIRG